MSSGMRPRLEPVFRAREKILIKPMIEFLSDAPVGPERFDLPGATVWIEGHVKGRDIESVAREATRQTRDSLASWLDRLDGHFRLVVQFDDHGFAAVDPVRSYPLVWAATETGAAVSHYGPAMEARQGLSPADFDGDMLAAVALSGFTIGDATLYRGVTQLGPGSYLWVDETGPSVGRYYRWEPWRPPTEHDAGSLIDELSALHRRLIEDLIEGVGGRPILVPISAGLDSRFVASGLKEAGYDNVQCVSYGISGNRDAEIGQTIAARLGFPWSFVPYSNAVLARIFGDPDYRRYMAYSDSLTGMHFPQEYRMLSHLRRQGALPEDAVVVNGQSGDFIAGNHIPESLFDPTGTLEQRLDRIVQALIEKHFKHWRSLRTPDRMAAIDRLLRRSIASLNVWPVDPGRDHGVYEYVEYQDRQSKYVVNGQRVYEYFGLAWRLPLWERAYLNFWETAPLAAKKGETLYKTVLERDNWGGVWRDVPVNPARIRPAWIRPLRFAAKVLHGPHGRERWHQSEKRYFDYWMTPTCNYAAWPYHKVARDRRGHYSPSGWHIESYLNDKGANWDGSVSA